MKINIEEYVKTYLTDKNIDFPKGMWPQDVVVDIASEVAEAVLDDKHPGMNHWVEDAEGTLKYSEESQDLFNTYYDTITQYLET